MALDMLNVIKQNNKKGEPTLFIVPVGPVGQYSHFVDMVNIQKVDLQHTTFINMDEYLDEDGRVPPS